MVKNGGDSRDIYRRMNSELSWKSVWPASTLCRKSGRMPKVVTTRSSRIIRIRNLPRKRFITGVLAAIHSLMIVETWPLQLKSWLINILEASGSFVRCPGRNSSWLKGLGHASQTENDPCIRGARGLPLSRKLSHVRPRKEIGSRDRK